jgi:hypothetical protein
MVVWIDTAQKSVSSHRESSGDIKTFSFDDMAIFDKFPKYGVFTLIMAKYDFMSPVKLGYDRYRNCTVVNFDKTKLSISVCVTHDGFFNQTKYAELRADKIESLIL